MLARAHRAFDHRVDDLEVRRVERERHVHRPARRHDVRREAHVVLDVARQQIGSSCLPSNSANRSFGILPMRVDEHVQAPAVRHADHELLHAGLAGALQQVVELRDQRLRRLRREKRFCPT